MDQYYFFQGEVTGEPKRERVPAKDEKPADRDRLDKEFKDEVAKLAERVKRERALSKWVYRVNAFSGNVLLFDRDKIYQVPRPPQAPVPPGQDAPPGHIDLK